MWSTRFSLSKERTILNLKRKVFFVEILKMPEKQVTITTNPCPKNWVWRQPFWRCSYGWTRFCFLFLFLYLFFPNQSSLSLYIFKDSWRKVPLNTFQFLFEIFDVIWFCFYAKIILRQSDLKVILNVQIDGIRETHNIWFIWKVSRE